MQKRETVKGKKGAPIDPATLGDGAKLATIELFGASLAQPFLINTNCRVDLLLYTVRNHYVKELTNKVNDLKKDEEIAKASLEQTPLETPIDASDEPGKDGNTHDKSGRSSVLSTAQKPSSSAGTNPPKSANANHQANHAAGSLQVVHPKEPSNREEQIELLEALLADFSSFSFTDKSKVFDLFDPSTKLPCNLSSVSNIDLLNNDKIIIRIHMFA